MKKGLEKLGHAIFELELIEKNAYLEPRLSGDGVYKILHDDVLPKLGSVEKELKALNIIVDKNVDILRVKITHSVEQYNERMIFGCKALTQEEYDLLKEVL